MIKNYGKSIRAKLLNLATREKQEYMKILARYFHERLLYRVSQSEYKPHLLLKGSSLLYAHYMFTARPTIDIDLLGHQISNDMEYMGPQGQVLGRAKRQADYRGPHITLQ